MNTPPFKPISGFEGGEYLHENFFLCLKGGYLQKFFSSELPNYQNQLLFLVYPTIYNKIQDSEQKIYNYSGEMRILYQKYTITGGKLIILSN